MGFSETTPADLVDAASELVCGGVLASAASVNGDVLGTFVSRSDSLERSCSSSSSSSKSEYVVERCVSADCLPRRCVSTESSDGARDCLVMRFESRVDADVLAIETASACGVTFLSLRMMFRATGFMVLRLEVADEPVVEDDGILTRTGLTLLPPCFAKSTLGTGGVEPGVDLVDPWPTETIAALPPMTCVAGMGLMTAESRKIVEAIDVRASDGAMDPGLRASVMADISE